MKRAAAIAFALLTVGFLALTGMVSTQAAAVCDPGAFLFRESKLWHFAPDTGAVTEITSVPGELNAMGVNGTDFYAIARPPARAVRFGTDGVLHTFGPIAGAPSDNFAATYSGAIDGDNWYLLQNGTIYTVSLSRKAVVSTAAVKGVDIGDWVAYEGRLLALSTVDATELVSIDPATGAVTSLGTPVGLPKGSSYGAVWAIDEQLYTLHNKTGQLFRIDMENPSAAVPVGGGGLATESSDGAACPAPAASPSPSPANPSSPVSPSPSPSLPPSPAVSPSAAPCQTSQAGRVAAPSPSACPGSAPPASPGPGVSPPRAQVTPAAVAPIAAVPPVPQPPRPPAPALTVIPHAPVGAHAVAQEARKAPVAAPPPDQSRARRWVAAAAVALGIGGMLGFLGVNRNRS